MAITTIIYYNIYRRFSNTYILIYNSRYKLDIMLPVLIIPIVIVWGGLGIVSFGKYIYKKCAYRTFFRKLTAQYLKQLETIGSGRNECVFCLDRFCENDMVVSLQCTHVFHKTCFMSYVSNEFKICPVCREVF